MDFTQVWESFKSRLGNQCFGSGSALKLTPWIRIHIRDADSGSGSRSFKNTGKWKKFNIFFKISLTYCEGLQQV